MTSEKDSPRRRDILSDRRQGTDHDQRTLRSHQSTDRHSQWKDTIDDWDAVLEGAEPNETKESVPDETANARSNQTPKNATERTTSDDSRSASPEETLSNATTASSNADSTASTTKSTGPIETDGGSKFVRIDPISDSLVNSITHVLPDPWLADTDGQQLIQWVVYAFVEETDPGLPTAARVRTAIDRTADRTDMNAAMLRQLCTNSLYRGRSGTPKDNFHSDLETIHRLTATADGTTAI